MNRIETKTATKRQAFFVTNVALYPQIGLCRNGYMSNQVKKIRNSLGLSQEEFADIVGISRVHLSRIETGKRGLSMKKASEFSESLEREGFGLVTPIEFFVNGETSDTEVSISDIEKELLNTFRGLSEREQEIYLNMGEAFLREDAGSKEVDGSDAKKTNHN